MGKKREEIEDRLFNFRPLFFTAVAFALGILFAYYHIHYGVSKVWLLGLFPTLGLPFLFCKNKKDFLKRALVIGVLCIAFFLGTLGFGLQMRNFAKSPELKGEYTVTGKVVDRTEYDYGVRLVLEGVFVDGKRVEGRFNATLPASFFEKVAIGDEVLTVGRVRTEKEFFDEHGFRAKDIEKKVRYSLSAENIVVTGKANDMLLRFRARMEEVVYGAMDRGNAAITIAVLTGSISAVDEHLMENIRYGGIAHIFAVSGMNVAALCAFFLILINKTPLRRISPAVRFVLLTGLLVFYAGVCSFSSSVVRATVMCLTVYAMKCFGGETDFLQSIGLSGLFILCYSPCSLFEVGFQLSFAACFGLAFLQKPIENLCYKFADGWQKVFPRKLLPSEEKLLAEGDTLPLTITGRVARWFGSLFAMSLAAQIATTPILLDTFGYISGWGLLLNLFFVPIISATFSLLLLAVCAACLFPFLATLLLYIPNLFWALSLLLFEIFDFSSFMITLTHFPMAAYIPYFSGCILLSDKWNASKRQTGWLATACFLTCILLVTLANL